MRLLPGLTLAFLLSGCPSGRPPPTRPPDRPVEPDSGVGDVITPPAPDDPDAPDEPDEVGDAPASRPAVSEPKSGSDLADTLDPPAGRAAVPGGCEGGTRRPGETWKLDCNACRCGDDGQSTCTAMACGAPPVR